MTTDDQISPLWMLVVTGTLVAAFYSLVDHLIEGALEVESTLGQFLDVVIMAAVTSVALWLMVLRPLLRRVRAERALAQDRWTPALISKGEAAGGARPFVFRSASAVMGSACCTRSVR